MQNLNYQNMQKYFSLGFIVTGKSFKNILNNFRYKESI